MKQRLLLVVFFITMLSPSYAQDSIWTLSRCIDHAHINNLSVKQAELDIKTAKMLYESSKYSHLPTLSISSSYGVNLGRSINPTTNQFENTKFSSVNFSANSGVLLFGWFQKKYAIQQNELKYMISNESLEQLKDDITLNIATAYLRVLLAQEQIKNVIYQLELSSTNKLRIEKLIQAGKSNILELSQSKNQLYYDDSSYLQRKMEYEQALIDLKVILNVDFFEPVAVTSENLDVYGVLPEELDPEFIYRTALKHIHTVQSSKYTVQAAQKEISISKAKQLPQISMYYSSWTNYSSSFYENFLGDLRLMPFWKQISNNLSNSFGLSLSIPVFTNFSSRDAVRRSKIELQKAEIAEEESLQKIKQDVFKACIDYKITLQRYKSLQSALKNAEISLKAATVRYEGGFIPYFEYLTIKNDYLQTQNDTSSLKYELYFKKIVIDYFLGLV